jgi:hypothetical protein
VAFADELAALNEWHFFREFVYSRNTFQPSPGQEVELADSLTWLGDLLLAFQLKERELVPGADEETEKRWFERKVLKQATRQVRDTVSYLTTVKTIAVQNHRGHTFDLSFESVRQFHKLVVYLPQDPLPAAYRQIKHHRSRTVGVIHIMPANDYLGIVRTLLTPSEVAEYLVFREELINRWEEHIAEVPEPALVGQYLNGDSEKRPSLEFLEHLRQLEHRANEWDMSGVIAKFPDRVTTDNAPTDYYSIVRELALLKRNELREFKKRFQMSVEKARANTFVRPYRITVPRTNCGFVFIPITRDMVPHRRTGLMNLTFAHKYEQRLPKCIGVLIADDDAGWFTAEWCYIENAWEEDPEMNRFLKDNNPFREVNMRELPRYTFRETP